MPDLSGLGRGLLLIGAVLVVIGGLLSLLGKLPWPGGLGRLPGDILIQRKNFTFYFPLATGLLISLILTLIFWFFTRR